MNEATLVARVRVRRFAAVAFALGAMLALTACAPLARDARDIRGAKPFDLSEPVPHASQDYSKPRDRYMTPREAREAIVGLAKETADRVDVGGWGYLPAQVDAGPCKDGWMKLEYSYYAPKPPASRDRAADANTVAVFWESRGFTTATVGKPGSPSVYAGDGHGLSGIAFDTGPGLYAIRGTTTCIPGEFEDYEDPGDGVP